ncbi:MAG: LysR substrate-binding domain-containing protein [Gemmataceae bacterium]
MAGPLPHLDTFALAAELGSFTGAARRLDPPLTQAAVSQRIAALEQELGLKLFDRVHGRVELTAAGRRLHEIAQQIQTLHDQARREIAQQAEGVRGELVLAASSVPGEHMLPSFMAEFRTKHPGIQVRAKVVDSAEVFDLVARGDAQLGMAGRASDSQHLEQRAFGRDEILLVLPPKHPLAKLPAVTLDQLRAEPLLLREPGSGSRRCVEQALELAGVSLADFRVAGEVSSNEAIKEMVQKGAGLAFLSRFAVADDVEARRLVALPVTGLNLTREFFAVHDRRRALPLPARLFLELLVN